MSTVTTPMPTRAPGTESHAPGTPTPAPVTAPVVAPAVAPVETPVVAPVVAPVDTPVKLDLDAPVARAQTTGNKTFDSVASLLSEKNVVGVDAIFKNIADNGEIALADHARIVEALGENIGALVVNQLTAEVGSIRSAKAEKTTATLAYMSQKFGTDPAQGAQAWAEVQAFTKTAESGFTDADRKAMTQMIQAGGMQAELVLDRIHQQYTNATGYTQQADLVQGDNRAHTAFTPMSRAEYSEQLKDAVNKYGYDSHNAEAIRQQRQKSIGLGY